MANTAAKVIVGDDVLDAARRAMGLPADAPIAQVIRAAVMRVAGHAGADGSEGVNRGGRPRGYSPKRATSTTNPI